MTRLLKWGIDIERSESEKGFDHWIYFPKSKKIALIQTKTTAITKDKMRFSFSNYDKFDFSIACCVLLKEEKMIFSPGVPEGGYINYNLNQFYNIDECKNFFQTLDFLQLEV